MTEPEFKPGDVVQLKSGGPAMTVEGRSAYTDDLICTWFEKEKKYQDTFPAATLVPYVKPRATFGTRG
ncbi:MAG: YodC family protein [Bauldia sp.]